ncbi:MAG: MBL fold metallo-hydrolase [Candidatus Omnitrophica bacterium]|nr:MBL fold metallo-hydrolase [Candidatus Omnitrophota bacterium]
MKFKVIFDKDTNNNNYYSGWGVSYLIDNKILFDTGEKSEYTIGNLKKLNVDIGKIEKIIISHKHWDHTGGLWDLLAINKDIAVFIGSDLAEEFKDKMSNYNFNLVDKWQKIGQDIYSSGCISISYKGSDLKEQVLVVRTEKGVSLISGCSHPGILKFIEEVNKKLYGDKIYAILGGFHLIDKDIRSIKYTVEKIKASNIRKIGPSHCTGYEAINIFRQFFSEDMLDMQVCSEFEL